MKVPTKSRSLFSPSDFREPGAPRSFLGAEPVFFRRDASRKPAAVGRKVEAASSALAAIDIDSMVQAYYADRSAAIEAERNASAKGSISVSPTPIVEDVISPVDKRRAAEMHRRRSAALTKDLTALAMDEVAFSSAIDNMADRVATLTGGGQRADASDLMELKGVVYRMFMLKFMLVVGDKAKLPKDTIKAVMDATIQRRFGAPSGQQGPTKEMVAMAAMATSVNENSRAMAGIARQMGELENKFGTVRSRGE